MEGWMSRWGVSCASSLLQLVCFLVPMEARANRSRSPQEVTSRLDSLIAEIKALQAPHMKAGTACDVVLFGHGHICRAFVKRWLGFDMGFSLGMMLEPGGVGILRYVGRIWEGRGVGWSEGLILCDANDLYNLVINIRISRSRRCWWELHFRMMMGHQHEDEGGGKG